MKIVLQTGDKAPKLFSEQVISEPDLDSGGVYVFVIDRKYLKVGSSRQMRLGIKTELAGFSKKVVTPKSSVEVFALENGDLDKEDRVKLRRKWVKFFAAKAPQGLLLNNTSKLKTKLKFEFAPDHNRWTQNLACIVTLQSPKLKKFVVNAEDLLELVAKGKKASAGRNYFWALDHLRELGWHTMGISFFERKSAPKTKWKAFATHKETVKAFK